MISEYISLLGKVFFLVITVVLPLFTGGTYWQLGDTKYLVFRNLTIISLGIWILLKSVQGLLCVFGKGIKNREKWSVMDKLMVGYAGTVLLSVLCSDYSETAFAGYREWYMGGLTQWMFVAVYFLLSRSMRKTSSESLATERRLAYAAEFAFAVVVGIGVLQKLGLDPLWLRSAYDASDWEYSHMLSTIGNINWFCGYGAVMLGIPVWLYLQSHDRMAALHYMVSCIGLTMLFVQGSDIGVIIAGAAIFFCIVLSHTEDKTFRRSLLLWIGTLTLVVLYESLTSKPGTGAYASRPVDGVLAERWNSLCIPFCILMVLLIICYLILYDTQKKKMTKVSYAVRHLFVLGYPVVGVVAGLYLVFRKTADGLFLSGRGQLWKLAWKGFLMLPPGKKLIGVGPDCFAEYVYSHFGPEELLALSGRWYDAVFANAHNEWLNHLLNLGIMGCVSYFAIFAVALYRYRRMPVGMITILLYLIFGMVGFQNVLSTPFLFLTLGLCEAKLQQDEKKTYMQ